MSPWRWLRREWQRFAPAHALILFTLVLGMSGLFLIGKLKASFLLSLRQQEREILASDLALSARRPLSAVEEKLFRDTVGDGAEASYRVLDMSSMLYAGARSRLAEVRVVEPGFPFYGKLRDESGPLRFTADHALFARPCLWLSLEMRRLTGSRMGDRLKLGEAWLEDCGTTLEDSTQGLRGFSLASRVYLARNHLAATKLMGAGSIATHALHVRLRPSAIARADQWKKALSAGFTEPGISVRTPRDASDQLARSGQLLGDYLQLASLVGLLLAVVGCFYLFRSLMHRRLKDIAVLRALGVSPARVRLLLATPMLADFVLAVVLAWLTATLVHPLLTGILGHLFNAQFPAVPFPWEWAWQAPMVLFVVACGLVPAVEEALTVPVRTLLQDQDHVGVLPFGRAGLFALLGLGAFTLLASGVARSWQTGALFMAGLVAAGLFLLLLAFLLRALLKPFAAGARLSAPLGLYAGLVVRRLLRRPVPTLLTLVALGLGGTLVSLLAHLEMSLDREFTVGAATRPALFLFDIQDEQKANLENFLAERGVNVLSISPMVRGKITEVNGQAFRRRSDEETGGPRTREQEDESRFRQRMMNLNWAAQTNSSEKIVEGVAFKDARVPEGEFAVSLEKRFAGRLDLHIDDRITFEILGVPVVGRVVNLRTVKWTSFLPNFFITFAPGALEEAPKTWLAALAAGADDADGAKLQNTLALAFPNISAVDVGQIVGNMLALFERLRIALGLMAWFAFFVGVVVVGAIAQDQVLRRQHEVMLEKALGLAPLAVAGMVLGEFVLLAALSLLGGGLAGAGIAAALVTQAFQADVVFSVTFILGQVLAGTALTLVPLLWSARKIFGWRPAGLLQAP